MRPSIAHPPHILAPNMEVGGCLANQDGVGWSYHGVDVLTYVCPYPLSAASAMGRRRQLQTVAPLLGQSISLSETRRDEMRYDTIRYWDAFIAVWICTT